MNFRKEATSGEEGVALFHAHPRALPDGADRAAHCVDASRNGRRAGQGRRRGLRGEALGRRAAADDDPQSAGAAAPVGRAGAGSAPACRVAGRARAEVRSVRPRVRERADARRGHEGHAHRRGRRARADHRAERLRQGSAGGDHPGQLERARRAVHQGQRRRAAEGSDGGRAVRRRSRRLHRRDQGAAGTLRGGRRRHVVPRRDRQPLARRPGEAAARAADRRVRAPRQQHDASRESARDQRDQLRPAGGDHRRGASAKTSTIGST